MSTAIASATRFHLGLFASDLTRSIQFYRTLFGADPVRELADYARFELDDPPLALTLRPLSLQGGGPLNHVGLRLTDAAELVEIQRRLEEAGIATQRQDGVECCYARQTKFWVTDPDRLLWEIYVLEGDIDHSGFDDAPLPAVTAAPARPGATWEHRLGEPFPARIPHEDGSLDEVQLLGLFNAVVEPGETQRRLAEVRRVLRGGGRLVAHGLVGDKPHDQKLDLPGLASRCERLPIESEPADALEEAGFGGIFYERLHDVNCLAVPGVNLSSFLLVAHRGEESCRPRDQLVMYKGPFERVTGDDGTVFPRGERVYLSGPACEALRAGPVAENFVFFSATKALPLLPIAQSCCSC